MLSAYEDGAAECLSMKESMRRRAMLNRPGIGGRLSARNQPASQISSPSILISPEAQRAVKPIIRLSGKGQGWLPK